MDKSQRSRGPLRPLSPLRPQFRKQHNVHFVHGCHPFCPSYTGRGAIAKTFAHPVLALEYAELHNAGYRGLYKRLDEDGIHRLKGLTKNQKILDHMSAAEGAANLFRITQAKIAMQARKPKTPQAAFDIAHEAGAETREAMKRIGGVIVGSYAGGG